MIENSYTNATATTLCLAAVGHASAKRKHFASSMKPKEKDYVILLDVESIILDKIFGRSVNASVTLRIDDFVRTSLISMSPFLGRLLGTPTTRDSLDSY